MLQHFGTVPATSVSPLEENLIFAEIEGFLSENLTNNVQKDGVMVARKGRRRGIRPFSVLAVVGVVALVALVPIGLQRAGDSGKAAHQAMRDAARGSLSD